MPSMQSTWTHGSGVVLESKPSWNVLRQAFFSTIRPSRGDYAGWVHFAIPTPVVFDGRRLKAKTAYVRFATGSTAAITHFHVFDGEAKIASFDDVDLRGGIYDKTMQLPNAGIVKYGVGISLKLEFSGTGESDFIRLVSAGIDFDS